METHASEESEQGGGGSKEGRWHRALADVGPELPDRWLDVGVL